MGEGQGEGETHPVKTKTYQPRFYRDWVKDSGLVSFEVVVRETDLHIRALRRLRAKALASVNKHRATLEQYIAAHPVFQTTLEPYEVSPDAPRIVREMARAATVVGVGPMAAVAGAIAEEVGHDLLPFTSEIIIENGGDIFMKVTRTRRIGVYAGEGSPFTGKIAVEIEPGDTPLGVATSSGTVGHSLSFGTADAAMVLAPSAYLADAAATALGNRVKTLEDVPGAVEWAQTVPGVIGVLVIKDDRLGIWGKVKIVRL